MNWNRLEVPRELWSRRRARNKGLKKLERSRVELVATHCSYFPIPSTQFDSHGPGRPRVNDRHIPLGKAIFQFRRRALAHGELGVGHDNEPRLEGIEEVVGEGIAGCRQSAYNDIRA